MLQLKYNWVWIHIGKNDCWRISTIKIYKEANLFQLYFFSFSLVWCQDWATGRCQYRNKNHKLEATGTQPSQQPSPHRKFYIVSPMCDNPIDKEAAFKAESIKSEWLETNPHIPGMGKIKVLSAHLITIPPPRRNNKKAWFSCPRCTLTEGSLNGVCRIIDVATWQVNKLSTAVNQNSWVYSKPYPRGGIGRVGDDLEKVAEQTGESLQCNSQKLTTNERDTPEFSGMQFGICVEMSVRLTLHQGSFRNWKCGHSSSRRP